MVVLRLALCGLRRLRIKGGAKQKRRRNGRTKDGRARTRRGSLGVLVPIPLAGIALFALGGCGASDTASIQTPSSNPGSYASEPFTHQQLLVEQGARLVLTDGCEACHLSAEGRAFAPSFAALTTRRVTLADARRVVFNESLLREALRHPGRDTIKGYDAAPMEAAVRRIHLAKDPKQITALAAFIEEIGPEPGG